MQPNGLKEYSHIDCVFLRFFSDCIVYCDYAAWWGEIRLYIIGETRSYALISNQHLIVVRRSISMHDI